MRNLKIGILGASGAVGREMLRLLEEYRIPVEELRLLAGAKSAGSKISFCGKRVPVQIASDESFEGLDYVLGASDAPVSRRFAPSIRRSGAVYIDNSSAFRLDPAVPLVVPEINGPDAYTHAGIIANPNCSTIITLMAVAAVHRLSPIRSMVVSTYQAVSGAGIRGLRELEDQLIGWTQGQEPKPAVFPAPIAMNVIPWIGAEETNGYTDEEMKMQNEGRRILHQPELSVSCTCVRVPVLRSHSISISLWTQEPVGTEAARRAIAAFPGCRIAENNIPTPLDVGGQDAVCVGRIRQELTHPNGLSLWCCGDQIRKGAAANALQILQLLEKP
ncbi:MAG: aspartate-semialdehyde dehydrogenase [Oscillospiraceae bacterium]|nr:aspartate-semialdehyde dehydrogenase [Oscillospiraceae bacterium]